MTLLRPSNGGLAAILGDPRIHLFIATGLSAGTARTEADEFLELHTLRLSQVISMADRGEIQDWKTLCALMGVGRRA